MNIVYSRCIYAGMYNAICTELGLATRFEICGESSTSTWRRRFRSSYAGCGRAFILSIASISLSVNASSLALFPPLLCLYHVDLVRIFPLVPHFLHVQNHLGRVSGSTEGGDIWEVGGIVCDCLEDSQRA